MEMHAGRAPVRSPRRRNSATPERHANAPTRGSQRLQAGRLCLGVQRWLIRAFALRRAPRGCLCTCEVGNSHDVDFESRPAFCAGRLPGDGGCDRTGSRRRHHPNDRNGGHLSDLRGGIRSRSQPLLAHARRPALAGAPDCFAGSGSSLPLPALWTAQPLRAFTWACLQQSGGRDDWRSLKPGTA